VKRVKQKFKPKYALKCVFFGKTKNRLSQRQGRRPQDPRVDTSAYYYNFVEFISILAQNAFYYPQQRANLLLLLPHLFLTSNSVVFVDGGRKNALPRAQGTLHH